MVWSEATAWQFHYSGNWRTLRIERGMPTENLLLRGNRDCLWYMCLVLSQDCVGLHNFSKNCLAKVVMPLLRQSMASEWETLSVKGKSLLYIWARYCPFSLAILQYTCLGLLLYIPHLISLLIERVVSHIGGGRHQQLLLHTHCLMPTSFR